MSNIITRNQILTASWVPSQYSKSLNVAPEVLDNIDKLVKAVNEFIKDYPHNLIITSGYRPEAYNKAVGGATKSNHTKGLAVDFLDKDNRFWLYVLNNLDKAKVLGLYFENKNWTPSWVHVQLGGPKSGKRIFIPNTNPPTDPDLFNGKYDEKYDK